MPDEEEIDVDVQGQVGNEDGNEEEFSLDFQGLTNEPAMGDNQMAPLNLTKSPMPDVMRVFQAMGDEDGIIIEKDPTDLEQYLMQA
jgi:hypothetical protein